MELKIIIALSVALNCHTGEKYSSLTGDIYISAPIVKST